MNETPLTKGWEVLLIFFSNGPQNPLIIKILYIPEYSRYISQNWNTSMLFIYIIVIALFHRLSLSLSLFLCPSYLYNVCVTTQVLQELSCVELFAGRSTLVSGFRARGHFAPLGGKPVFETFRWFFGFGGLVQKKQSLLIIIWWTNEP